MSDHVSPYFLWISFILAIVLAVYFLIEGWQITIIAPLLISYMAFHIMYLYSRYIYKTKIQPNRVEKLKEKMEE